MQTNTEILEPRAVRGYRILMNGSTITQLDQTTFLVPSQSKNAKYLFIRMGKNGVVSVRPPI